MKRFLFGVFSICAGLCLLPFCASITMATGSLVGAIRPASFMAVPYSAWSLGAGFLLWLVIYSTLPRPVRTYVLAHELTHALWAWLTGAKVRSMKVSKSSGSVVISSNNILITLAPYFFPLYTVIIIAAYYPLALFMDVGKYEYLWLFLVGFTWGFHITFTVSALLERQTDILEYGRILSLAFIYIFNVLGIGVWIVIVSSASFIQYARLLMSDTWMVWTRVAGWFLR